MRKKKIEERNGSIFSHLVKTYDPLVSIVTVCRNAEKTIEKAIKSVLDQSYSKLEYIVVDGGSNDKTLDVVKRYEPYFKGRLRWISEKDNGIYDAMNKGIRLARGDIVGLINSDDWYEPDAVKTVAKEYKTNGNAVYYGILRVLENGREVSLRLNNHEFLHRDVLGHPAYFVAKPLYEQHGLYRLDYKIAADFELMMRLIQRHVRFVQINRVLANFSYGGESFLRESNTIEEYLRIRCEYGYLGKRELCIRLIRLRISHWLNRLFDI